MKKTLLAAAALPFLGALSLPLAAEDTPHPAPGEIVAQAKAGEWVAIPAEDLLVMTLAPDAEGKARQVVIQLMPAPFSQGWVQNIRLFARSGWYDNISVNRVQDNYVVQWGDPNYDNPEATGETKKLPEGLKVVSEREYVVTDLLSIPDERGRPRLNYTLGAAMARNAMIAANGGVAVPDGMAEALQNGSAPPAIAAPRMGDAYGSLATLLMGWPVAGDTTNFWPVHCYGMVGVGRNLSPDTGSGAELYTVIGHAPRHLDRNIALVGRVIEGMEHLSSLPRGKGALGFYAADEVHRRTPILTVRVASDLAPADQPKFEYLSTEGETFARYAEARANRRDPFFNVPAGGADICNVPVPIRRVAE